MPCPPVPCMRRVPLVRMLVLWMVVAPWVPPSLAAPSPPPADLAAPGTPPSSSLDRALRVDTNAGQRNLELLLESRNADEGMAIPAERRAPAGPSGGAPGGAQAGDSSGEAARVTSGPNIPGAAAAGPAAGPTPPVPLTSGQPAPVALPGLADVRPGLLPVAPAGGDGRQAQVAGEPPVQTAAQRDLEAALRTPVIRETLLYLRANRDWLLAALAAVLVLVVLVQAGVRRLSNTPQAREAAAAARARARADDLSPSDSRRSSRRGERSREPSGDNRLVPDGEHRRRRRRSSRRD